LTLRDWSGRNNHGSVRNGAFFNITGGKFQLNFDGVNDYVLGSKTIGLSNASNFTITARVFPTAISAVYGVFAERLGGSGPVLAVFNNTMAFFSGSWAFSTTSLTVNTPQTVCLTYDTNGSSLKWYLNGIADGSGTAGSFSSSSATEIGSWDSGANVFAGGISELMVHNRVLTENEIRLLSSRSGIAYELAPHRRSSSAVQFNRRRRLLLGST
jgi:hypothetical protein